MAVARTVLTTAMISVFPKDVRSALFSNSFTYQLNVNPFQLRYGFEVVALNEFAITTEIGRKRNRYTAKQNILANTAFSFVLLFLFISYTPNESMSPPSFW